MADESPLIPPHGGYRKLKTFQIARLIYDLTVRFCDRYIDKRSRTHDQMVQTARSGVQNIAEGSEVSATSKKMEIKLTNVARGSLEELKLDYEDFLRHRGMPMWAPNHPALVRFKKLRCKDLEEVRRWIKAEMELASAGTHEGTRTRTDTHGHARSSDGGWLGFLCANPCTSVFVRAATGLCRKRRFVPDQSVQLRAGETGRLSSRHL